MAPPKEDENDSPKRYELRGGMTALMSAASAGSVPNIELLLSHAQKTFRGNSPVSFEDYVNAVDVSGLTAMAWACSVPNRDLTIKTLEVLDANGARDDSLTVDGRGLMHVAANGRNARAVAWLVDVKRHAVDARSPGKQHTPLLIAAFQGSPACVRALLRRGADVRSVLFCFLRVFAWRRCAGQRSSTRRSHTSHLCCVSWPKIYCQASPQERSRSFVSFRFEINRMTPACSSQATAQIRRISVSSHAQDAAREDAEMGAFQSRTQGLVSPRVWRAT